MQDMGKPFAFPDRADPITDLELQPPLFAGSPRNDRDAIAILLCAELRDSKGLHAETMLTAVGALVGRAAMMAVSAHAAVNDVPSEAMFHHVETTAGTNYLFSDAVNCLLFEGIDGWTDFWSLLSAMATALDQPVQEDAPRQWAAHFAASLGSEAEGQPELTDGQFVSTISAFDAARRFWPGVEALLKKGGGDQFDQCARLMLLAAALLPALAQAVPAYAAASHVMQAAMAAAKLPFDIGPADLFALAPPLPEPGEAADLSRIADPHFPYRPSWNDCATPGSAVEAVLSRMDGGNAATIGSVQRSAAPFWGDEGMLWRGHVTSGQGRAGRLYVLQIGTEVFLLAFAGADIAEISSARPPVIETAAMAADWFRFSLGFGGPLSGRPRLVEQRADLCLVGALNDARAAVVDDFLTPLSPQRLGDRWLSPATVLIDDRLAKVELSQKDGGELTIVPKSDPHELLHVPIVADPFAALVVGPFIPDQFSPQSGTPDPDPDDYLGPYVFATDILWREASSEQREALLEFIVDNGSGIPGLFADCRVRHAALSFYPALALCEVTAGERGMDVLINVDASGSEALFPMDGTSDPIFRANAHHLALTAETVCDYTAFYFGHVKELPGRMPLLHNMAVLEWLEESNQPAYNRLAPFVPPVVTAADDDGFIIGAVMLFEDALFRAVIRIHCNGLPQVLEREKVLTLDDPELDFED